MTAPLLRYGEWFRRGRGNEQQFFALDSEIDRWLSEELPREFWPWHLFSEDQVKEGRTYSQRLVRWPNLELSACRAQNNRTSFWVGSRRISPKVIEQLSDPRDLTANGFILVQQHERRGKRDLGRIAVAGRHENARTGELREHAEYLRVFQSLRRRIRKDLTYTTVTETDFGIFVDDRLSLMTTAAADAARAGIVHFTRQPGPLLEEFRRRKSKESQASLVRNPH